MIKLIKNFFKDRKENKQSAEKIGKLLNRYKGGKLPLKEIKTIVKGVDRYISLYYYDIFLEFVRSLKKDPPLDCLEEVERLQKILSLEELSSLKENVNELKEVIETKKKLHMIESGNHLPVIEVDVLLKTAEEAYFDETVTFHEERTRRIYQGRSSGTSIRVAKGVSFRVGASKGDAVNEDYLKEIDKGEFVITNKRIIFVGGDKNWNIVLAKLLRIQEISVDGQPSLAFSTESTSKKKLVSFKSEDKMIEAKAIINRIVKE